MKHRVSPNRYQQGGNAVNLAHIGRAFCKLLYNRAYYWRECIPLYTYVERRAIGL